MRKLLTPLTAMLLYFCAATVIAQIIGLTLLLTGGNVSREGAMEILAIAQGVDVFAIRLDGVQQTAQVAGEQRSTEQNGNDRAVKVRDLELREQAVDSQTQMLRTEKSNLVSEREEYERLREVFRRQTKEQQDKHKTENLATVVATIQKMKPKWAKLLLTAMLDNGELDRVVAILFEMPNAERAKIVHEFKTEGDLELLDTVLKRLGDGGKKGDIIRDTLNSLGPASTPDPASTPAP